MINEGRIQLQPHVLEKLADFPENIKSKKELQSFLGVLNYAAKDFLPILAKIKQPLQVKLKKNVEWIWTPNDTLIVRQIKNHCSNLPPLELPTENDYLLVQTDASDDYWAGVLLFKNYIEPNKFDKHLSVARYLSGSWSDTERRWTIFDKELRAVVLTLSKLKIFLFNKFVLQVDSKSVVGFIKNRDLCDTYSAKQIRDKGKILYYREQMEIEHISGKRNFIADALTRRMAHNPLSSSIKGGKDEEDHHTKQLPSHFQ